jgi:hypothetical protein
MALGRVRPGMPDACVVLTCREAVGLATIPCYGVPGHAMPCPAMQVGDEVIIYGGRGRSMPGNVDGPTSADVVRVQARIKSLAKQCTELVAVALHERLPGLYVHSTPARRSLWPRP